MDQRGARPKAGNNRVTFEQLKILWCLHNHHDM
jgi:hypothetical protein